MLRYQVDDITCGHCVQAITQAVKGVDAGAEVTVNLRAKQVAVTSQASGEAIVQAIRAAGYTPQAPRAATEREKGGCCGRC